MMMKNADRDRDKSAGRQSPVASQQSQDNFERLVRDTLKARDQSSSPESCLDAETAAAWADETLDPRERSAAEAHAADCARCQALVAAMVKTSPPAVARSWWRVPAIGYLIPLTAAAAGVTLWAILPSRSTFEPNNRAVAAVSTVSTAADSLAAEKAVPAQPAAIEPRTIAPRGEPNEPQPQRPAASLSARASINVPVPAQLGERSAVSGKVANAAPVPAPSVDSAAAPPSPAGILAASPPQAAARALAVRESASALVLTDTVSASPNPAIRWRIVPGSAGSTIERSMDSGSSWQRVAFPEVTELVSIRATDDKTASVTTSDGRTFNTTDGGLTWVRSPSSDPDPRR